MHKVTNWPFFTIVLLVMLISSCSFEDDPDELSIPKPETDLVSTNITIGEVCDNNAESQKISFAHLADLHANFAMQDRKFEKLKYFYQQLKQQNPYTIFTNAGDDYEKGSVTEALSAGKSVKESIFAMEFDVRTIGNHDFAWGVDELLEYVQDPHAKVLASNTKYIGSDDDTFDVYDFVQAQVGCVKVGFFGMVSLPWNELDETYDGQFLPEVINNFSYNDISQDIISNFRSQVDILVLISHLGIVEDSFLADSILGIDLILGGHSHSGVVEKTIGDTLVIQPEFFADGISQIDIDFDLVTQKISSITHQNYNTSEMENYDPDLAQTLDDIAERYASDRHDIIAYAEYTANGASLADISLQAIHVETQVDVVLLNPSLVWTAWKAGGLSKQDFYNAYNVERQKSDTPGFNSIYKTSITGANIKKMLTQQPLWLYKGVTELDDSIVYSVALNKGPAINIPAFFNDGVEYFSTSEFVAENWQILSDYGIRRTANCTYMDSDNIVITCIKTEHVLFDFNSDSTPLDSSEGVGEMTAYDTLNNNWFIAADHINTSEVYSIPAPNVNSGNIFKFDAFDENQGMVLSHILEPNGYLVEQDKLSYYSLIFDLYIPSSDHDWLAIYQTDLQNSDDAELFIHKDIDNGVGNIQYFSGIKFDTWQRLAAVVHGNIVEGVTNLFIDGTLVGTIKHIDDLWAIKSSLLMFTDNNAETRNGYIDNILLVNKPLTEMEIQMLGGADQEMSTKFLPVGINE